MCLLSVAAVAVAFTVAVGEQAAILTKLMFTYQAALKLLLSVLVV
jgi:hypothetical protein